MKQIKLPKFWKQSCPAYVRALYGPLDNAWIRSDKPIFSLHRKFKQHHTYKLVCFSIGEKYKFVYKYQGVVCKKSESKCDFPSCVYCCEIK